MKDGPKINCYLDDIIAERKRQGKRITKVEIARKLGMTKQALTNISQGKVQPTLRNSLRIAEILEVTVHDLWKLQEPTEEDFGESPQKDRITTLRKQLFNENDNT